MINFFTLDLKASRLGANLISNGKEFHISTIQEKFPCIGMCRQVACEMFVASSEALDAIRSLVEKIISPALFDTNCSFKR